VTPGVATFGLTEKLVVLPITVSASLSVGLGLGRLELVAHVNLILSVMALTSYLCHCAIGDC
jgi:hypothetical protein